MRRPLSTLKLSILGLVITSLFWLFLEISARVLLSIKTADPMFLKYGFTVKDKESNTIKRVFDEHEKFLYHQCEQGNDPKNPVNSLGCRGPEILDKKHGTIRIVCVGGSTTYGLPLDYKDSYPKILQDKLDAQAGAGRFEVINAGVPAQQLSHIINQAERILLPLRPEIIVLMSVFNNLVSDEKDFSFISIAGEEQNIFIKYSRKAIAATKRYSALVMVVDEIAQKGFRDYLRDFNWHRGADAIMRSTKVWECYSADMHRLFSLLIRNNPTIKILMLGESMNVIDYPELAPPIQNAFKVQQEVCSLYANVQFIDLMTVLMNAQKNGEKIWVAPYYDPIHLSHRGNELIAEVVLKNIPMNNNVSHGSGDSAKTPR